MTTPSFEQNSFCFSKKMLFLTKNTENKFFIFQKYEEQIILTSIPRQLLEMMLHLNIFTNDL